MNILYTQHYREFRVALSILGQWPSQPPFQRYCARFVVLLAIFSIITPKIIKFVECIRDVDLDNLIECLPMVMLHLASLCKYFNWIFNEKKVNNMLFLIDRDGQSLTVDQDIGIMNKWLERIRKITWSYTISMFSILAMYLASPAVPKILDIVAPLNETREKIFLYQTEYFVDQDEYYIHILIHAYMTVPISLGALVYFDNMLATNVAHACAMFDIVSAYLGKLNYKKVNFENDDDDLRKLHGKICRCVDMHKNALRFSRNLESSVSFVLLLILLFNLLILTVTGMVTIMKLDQLSEGLKFAAFTLGAVFHLFYTSLHGQDLIQQSKKVFHAAYMSQWYNLPPQCQKLLIPIMMKSMMPCTVRAGKKFVLSMETFSMVLQKSMSFFTVLSSTR
ncbi:odorant receptor Or2-like [Cotesia typhae]|uniref:odorant receptor Or2-like n=1 Tax=Cotesia typhae TaxID=2053667 RepID=UPI003D68CB9C